jgi:hypothetical protein
MSKLRNYVKIGKPKELKITQKKEKSSKKMKRNKEVLETILRTKLKKTMMRQTI